MNQSISRSTKPFDQLRGVNHLFRSATLARRKKKKNEPKTSQPVNQISRSNQPITSKIKQSIKSIMPRRKLIVWQDNPCFTRQSPTHQSANQSTSHPKTKAQPRKSIKTRTQPDPWNQLALGSTSTSPPDRRISPSHRLK